MTETISDFIPTANSASLCTIIIYFVTNQPNEAKRFWAYFYSMQLNFHTMDAFAHMISIILFRSRALCLLIALSYTVTQTILTDLFIPPSDLDDFLEGVTNISILKFTSEMALIAIYGFDRCPTYYMSKHLFFSNLTDDDIFWENSWYVWIQFCTFNAVSIVYLLLMQNFDLFERLISFMNKGFSFKSNNSNEIELRYTSGTTFERFCYINEVDVTLEVKPSTSGWPQHRANKSYKKQIGSGYEDKQLSIAWIDMTLRVKKTFFSNEKLILREINGFVRFGTLTALMGPSGAGKSSLLRCLNGLNRNLITRDSKILLSDCRKIRICFIAQDQREHITKGLTVKQGLKYASKIKNTGKPVDHDMKVNELMTDLNLNGIQYNCIEKCSSGEQKRIVLAMELTSEVKPNLICVDEPTSGIDNSTAYEVSIDCEERFNN